MAFYKMLVSTSRLTQCISDLQHWFLRNKLLLNGDKSDAIIFGTAQRHARSPPPQHLTVADCNLAAKDSLKLLGVTLDNTMSFNKHVMMTVRTARLQLSYFSSATYTTSPQ